MRKIFHRAFIAHPQSVDESYAQHFCFALRFSGTLFLASIAALVHAVVPFACEKTASSLVNQLHHRMHNR